MGKSPNKVKTEQPAEQPIVHNRMRPERIASDDPKAKKAQTRYYANQAIILAKKKQYRKEIKAGTRVVIPKNLKEKELTKEQKHELRKRKKREDYKNNSKNILAYQAKYKQEKAQEKKRTDAKNAIDEFNKLNGW